MGVGWSMIIQLARMIWKGVRGWVVSCLILADEIAVSLRTGDLSPYHVA
ncbi:hypothetical protein ACJIZ3_019220 [Penstemon smallii]|uniref:Uncharacterized protein n=1 Tax=Penstemon smallii TaxID=265156 RepID=A0ABD3T208_9LAMI